MKIQGATSFKYLKTINGIEYPNFREAAVALGLISVESIWQKSLIEAIQVETKINKIRQLFAVICIQCQPVNPSPRELWDIFREDLISDYVKRGYPEQVAVSKALGVILFYFIC